MRFATMKSVLALIVMALAAISNAAAKDIELSFYYPVAVGGPITKIIDGYAADFEKENPGIKINADLRRHLPGHLGQGADRPEERQAAGCRRPAVDRHVHVDRRGRGYAL